LGAGGCTAEGASGMSLFWAGTGAGVDVVGGWL
jgi:hypothetical protein